MDPTEARYAEISRVMVELNDWVTPWFDYGVPFWGKPPFAFWLSAASFKLLGVNEFAGRLPHWICGVLVVCFTVRLALRHSRAQALYAAALLVGSLVFFASAGAVMTDMALTFGTTMAFVGFWNVFHEPLGTRSRESWWLFLGLSIGLLAKGPVALVLFGLPIAFWALQTRQVGEVWRRLPWLRGLAIAALISLPWYIAAERHTPGFLKYFLVGEHWQRFVTPGWKGDLYGVGHQYPRGTIWGFMFLDILPWAVLFPIVALHSQHKSRATDEGRHWRLYLLCWALTPAIFFSFAGNVLWPYVLPGVPGLALLAAHWLALRSGGPDPAVLLSGGLVFTLIVTLGLLCGLTLTGRMENESTKALVLDYERHRTTAEGLVFFPRRPFSATFYTAGRALVASDEKTLETIAKHETFVALDNRTLREPPRNIPLELVAVHGGYTLYRVPR
jgi:4-amino-4-deoxy-L-arabinose transferase-like glycosyltransferase